VNLGSSISQPRSSSIRVAFPTRGLLTLWEDDDERRATAIHSGNRALMISPLAACGGGGDDPAPAPAPAAAPVAETTSGKFMGGQVDDTVTSYFGNPLRTTADRCAAVPIAKGLQACCGWG